MRWVVQKMIIGMTATSSYKRQITILLGISGKYYRGSPFSVFHRDVCRQRPIRSLPLSSTNKTSTPRQTKVGSEVVALLDCTDLL